MTSLSLFFAAIWVLSVAVAQEEITPEELFQGIETGLFDAVIDVRSEDEWNNVGHIENATLVADLASTGMPDPILNCKTCTIAVYCQSGNRAGRAITRMKEVYGFEGTLYNGLGVSQWKQAGYPLVTSDSVTPKCQASDCDCACPSDNVDLDSDDLESYEPSLDPSSGPTSLPSRTPTVTTLVPSLDPTPSHSLIPTSVPSFIPTSAPSDSPSTLNPISTAVTTMPTTNSNATNSPSETQNNVTSTPSMSPNSSTGVTPSSEAPVDSSFGVQGIEGTDEIVSSSESLDSASASGSIGWNCYWSYCPWLMTSVALFCLW